MLTQQLAINGSVLTKEDYRVSVENVVASGKLDQRLDLDLISGTVPGARYEPQRFPGLFFNMKKPKSLLLLFSTGKIISMGTRSVRQAKKAIVNAVKELQSIGVVILTEPTVQIQNMVACADLKTRVDLEDLAMVLRRTIYEPENFPGLIYVMDEPKVTLLLFTNGKIVCAGAKSEDDVYRAVAKIHETLRLKGFVGTDERRLDTQGGAYKKKTVFTKSRDQKELACLAPATSN
jgi:transcription initiation factor TFIID TATA-box-binding protein